MTTLSLPNITRVQEEADNLFRRRPHNAQLLQEFAAWVEDHRIKREQDDCDLDRGLGAGLRSALPSCASIAERLATFEAQVAAVGRGEPLATMEDQRSFIAVLAGWSLYRCAME